MNERDKLRWGVIGLGVGEQHAITIDMDPSMHLAAICDVNPEKLTSVEKRFNSATPFTDEFALIHSGTIDAVVIASYDNRHTEAIVAALDSGLHVFCEKPLVTSRQELEKVVAALNRNPFLHLMTNTLLRRSPRFSWLKREISSGRLGTVYHADLTYLYGRLSKVVSGWRGEDPNYSVTLGGAIHLIDLLIWLVEERPQKVVGMGASTGTSRSALYRSERHLIQDFRMGLLEFASGTTAAVSANYACVLPHFHRVEIYGTSGTFMNLPQSGSSPEASAALFYPSRDPDVPPVSVDLPYPAVPKGALIPRFAAAIRGGEPEISAQAAIDAVVVALAIDDAVLRHQAVEVSYPHVLPRQSSY